MKIKFDEPSHTYTHLDTKEKFTSVTTFLARYKPPFDTHKHATRVARSTSNPGKLRIRMVGYINHMIRLQSEPWIRSILYYVKI